MQQFFCPSPPTCNSLLKQQSLSPPTLPQHQLQLSPQHQQHQQQHQPSPATTAMLSFSAGSSPRTLVLFQQMMIMLFLLSLSTIFYFSISPSAQLSRPVADGFARQLYTFTISTGHTGTHTLTNLFKGCGSEGLLAVHEDEPTWAGIHVWPPWQTAMQGLVKPACLQPNSSTDMYTYVRQVKLPHLQRRMADGDAFAYFDTGHQVVLGMVPPLVELLGADNVGLIRLRRNRLMVARSFFLDPTKHGHGPCRFVASRHHIVLCPWQQTCAGMIPVSEDVWRRLNVFQQYLWYIDEVESHWQSLIAAHPRMRRLEVDIEDKNVTYAAIADFVGFDYDEEQTDAMLAAHAPHSEIDEEEMESYRLWDAEYRQLVFQNNLPHWLSEKTTDKER